MSSILSRSSTGTFATGCAGQQGADPGSTQGKQPPTFLCFCHSQDVPGAMPLPSPANGGAQHTGASAASRCVTLVTPRTEQSVAEASPCPGSSSPVSVRYGEELQRKGAVGTATTPPSRTPQGAPAAGTSSSSSDTPPRELASARGDGGARNSETSPRARHRNGRTDVSREP